MKESMSLKRLEGEYVIMTLADGSRLEECQVVSAGRAGGSVWLCIEGLDAFVPQTDIREIRPLIR